MEGFNVFLKGGGAGAETSSNNVPFREEEDIGVFGGAGVGYEFGAGWGLRLEYEYFFEDLQMITLGLSKRFGLFGRDEEVAEPVEPQEPRLEVAETTLGDEDEDGVPDNVDRCSGTPAGTIVDEIGCEVPPLPPVETLEEVSLDARGLFRVNSARVTPQGKENLREFVENLGNYEQMNAIVVEGHTDSSGGEAYNLELARQIADNGTAEGRAKNRHVELKVRAVRKTQ